MPKPEHDYLRRLVAQNIGRGMRRQGFSDEDLAREIKTVNPGSRVTAHQVYRWRAGRHGPSVHAMHLLADVLFAGEWTQMVSDTRGQLWGGTAAALRSSEELERERITVGELHKRIEELERRLSERHAPADIAA